MLPDLSQPIELSDPVPDELAEMGRRLDAIAISLTTTVTSGITGFIALKFIHFLSISDVKEQRWARCLGSVALVLHLVQLIIQLENTMAALSQFVIAKPFNMFLYEGIETLITLFLVIIVQVHFSRVVHVFLKKWRWLVFAATSCSVTCAAGLATSIILIADLSDGRLKKDTPAKLSGKLTGCWAVWLSSVTIFDITLLFVLTNQILKQRAEMVQVEFRSVLRRILLIAVYAFLLTSMTSLGVIVLIIISEVSSSENYIMLSKLRIAAFVSNSFLPRIYLLAFCSSLTGKRKTIKSKQYKGRSSNGAPSHGALLIQTKIHRRHSYPLKTQALSEYIIHPA